MRLDEAIVTYLDAAQWAAAAEVLGLDWAALPGETATARAAALATAAGRRGRWAALLAALLAACPDVPWADLATPLPTLHTLHTDLCRRHTLDGLRMLCFRLGVDFDDLPGDSKAGRARELVLWMERAGRAAELWPNVSRYEIRKTRYELKRRRLPLGRRFFNRCGRLWREFVHLRERPVEGTQVRKPVLQVSVLLCMAAALLMVADGRRLLTIAPAAITGLPTTTGDPSPTATPTAGDTPSPASATVTGAPSAVASPIADAPPVARDLPLATCYVGVGQLGSCPYGPPVDLPAYVVVGPRGANLRQGPGEAYAVVATLRAGAQLEVRAVSPTGEWVQVRLPGKGSPWIDARYAVLGAGLGGLPVATAARPTAQPTAAPTDARPVTFGAPSAAITPRPVIAPTRTPAAPPPTPTLPPP